MLNYGAAKWEERSLNDSCKVVDMGMSSHLWVEAKIPPT